MKIKFSCGVIHVGSCLDVLPTLPDNSVHCAITSPPYYSQRDYGTGEWSGGRGECDHVERKVGKSESVYRKSTLGVGNYRNPASNPAYRSKAKLYNGKCKKCGAVRLDSQLGQEKTVEEYVANMVKVFRQVKRVLRNDATFWLNIGDTFRDGQCLGVPWRLAFAMQADGWVLRVENIWHAMNKIPEPVDNRCSRAHEYLFHFAKTRRYYYDGVAIMTKAKDTEAETANKRTVWGVATKSFKGSHFAVMPDLLVAPCILAGTSEKGCCVKCGSPWERVVEKIRTPTRPGTNTKVAGTDDTTHGNRDPRRHITKVITKGWRPTCECGIKEIKPCVVVDPFFGAGTVGKVAVSKNRHFIGIELNPKYAELSRKRINKAIMNRGFGL